MNELIVWDKVARCFAENISLDADLLQDGISYSLDVKGDLYELFFPIGLTDIDGNKIFAQSSIIEFYFKCFGETTTAKFTAFFQYNEDELRYELIILNYDKSKTKSIYSVLSYNMDLMKSFKIIGTIQENPELLEELKC